MPEYQRRHIAVSPEERRRLEAAKARYEAEAGPSDWGGFLTAVVSVGLAGLGMYALAKLLQRSERSAKVSCPECQGEFTVALPVGGRTPLRVIEFDCPHCQAELVLDLEAKGG